MRATPFARSLALIQALASLAGGARQSMFDALGGYTSRGHGQGKISGKKKGNEGTPWKARLNGQTNGKREIARRLRQIEKGMLHVSA